MEKVTLEDNYYNKFTYFLIQNNDLEGFKKLLPDSLEINRVTLHWSAGGYKTPFTHYAINIGDINSWVANDIQEWRNHSHSWHDNSSNLGCSLLSMGTPSLKPTDLQIESLINYLTIVCDKYKLNPFKQIFSHADRARLYGYYPDRVDVEIQYKGMLLTDYIRNKVAENLKHPKETIQLIEHKPQTSTMFQDVFKEQWFSSAIEFLYYNGVLAGFNENGKLLFKPFVNLTREIAFVLLSKTISFLQIKTKVGFKSGLIIGNSEIEQSNYKQQIYNLVSFGIIQGDTQGKFNLNNELTRAELSVLLNKVFLLINENLTAKIQFKPLPEETFIDLPKNHWAYKDIETCVQTSLLIGYKKADGYYFNPDGKITRAEFSASMYKLIKVFEKNGAFK